MCELFFPFKAEEKLDLAGYHYADTGRGSHILNHHLENQMFDEDSKVLAGIEFDRIMETVTEQVQNLKDRFEQETGEDITDWKIGQISNEELNNMLASGQTEELQLAINELREAWITGSLDTLRLHTLDSIRTFVSDMNQNMEAAESLEKTFAEQVDEVMAGTFPFYGSLKVAIHQKYCRI